jgi:hypothetical protein
MQRRTFITRMLSVAVVVPLGRVRRRAEAGVLPEKSLATLREVAAVALPSALGRRSTDQVVARFADWVRDYKAGVSMEHGYGRPRLRTTEPLPVENYIRQLADIDQAGGQRFARLGRDARRAILEKTLNEAKVENLPNRPTGEHVVSDLVAFYFHSSEANDLCYRANIGMLKCRNLASLAKRPEPL